MTDTLKAGRKSCGGHQIKHKLQTMTLFIRQWDCIELLIIVWPIEAKMFKHSNDAVFQGL